MQGKVGHNIYFYDHNKLEYPSASRLIHKRILIMKWKNRHCTLLSSSVHSLSCLSNQTIMIVDSGEVIHTFLHKYWIS